MRDVVEIQTRAIKSLKSEFETAAQQARQKILDATEFAITSMDVEELDGINGYMRPSFSYNLGYARQNTQFLLRGALGEYHSDFGVYSLSKDQGLWADYLRSIDRLALGKEGRDANTAYIDGLIQQFGAYEMEKRLTEYLKGRIDAAVDKAAYCVAPKYLKTQP